MKNTISLILVLILALGLTACGGSDPVDEELVWATDASGNSIYFSENGSHTMAEKLPADLAYNGKSITVTGVSAYEDYLYFSYYLVVVIEMDVSELNNQEVLYLRENDISFLVSVTDERNKLDSSLMQKLGDIYYSDQNKLVQVLMSPEPVPSRYSLGGGEVSVRILLNHRDTYTNWLIHTFEIAPNIPKVDSIPKPLGNSVAKWIEARFE